MIDKEMLRKEPEKIRKALESRGADVKALDELVKLDEEWKARNTPLRTCALSQQG